MLRSPTATRLELVSDLSAYTSASVYASRLAMKIAGESPGLSDFRLGYIDGASQVLQPSHQPFGRALTIELVQILRSQIVIDFLPHLEIIGNLEDGTGYRNSRPTRSAAGDQTLIEGMQIGSLGPSGGVRGLD